MTREDLRTSLEFFRTAPRHEVLDELVRYGFMTEEERRRLDRNATDTTTPDAWNAATSPFDPMRAGFTCEEGGLWSYMTPERYSFNMSPRDGCMWKLVVWYPERDSHAILLPSELSHADVLSILRVNGYTGGDDE